MKTIIAGSRTILDYHQVRLAIQESGFEVTEVVSGGARGVDALGEQWARDNDIRINRRFLADWSRHGRAAGPIRNGEMARYAQALIAIYDGESRGTADMIRQAEKAGLLVYVKTVAAGRPAGRN